MVLNLILEAKSALKLYLYIFILIVTNSTDEKRWVCLYDSIQGVEEHTVFADVD